MAETLANLLPVPMAETLANLLPVPKNKSTNN